MNKKCLASLIFLQLLWSSLAWSYIENIKVIELKDGRQIMLFYDAYEGYSIQQNETQAFALAMGLKNLALKNSTIQVDVSYEDSGVYDAENIIDYVDLLYTGSANLPEQHSICLVASFPGSSEMYARSFKKAKKFTSFLGGGFTLALTLLNKLDNNWPVNLKVRSNDPRQQHYLALTKDHEWMTKYGDTTRLRDFVTPAWLLRNKELYFAKDPSLSPEATKILEEKINVIRVSVHEQLEAFANFIAIKTGDDFSVQDLGLTVNEAKAKMDLDLVHQHLMQFKKIADVYSEAPRVDLLLSIFAQGAPDFFVVILGNGNATKFERDLNDLGVVSNICPLAPEQTIAKLVNDK